MCGVFRSGQRVDIWAGSTRKFASDPVGDFPGRIQDVCELFSPYTELCERDDREVKCKPRSCDCEAEFRLHKIGWILSCWRVLDCSMGPRAQSRWGEGVERVGCKRTSDEDEIRHW